MIVEQRADGKVETEATIKIWVDGERYVRTAEGNGPVNALDAALRDAIGEIHPHLQGHRARQLQGPHPRRDHGTGAIDARAHRRLRRPATSGARSASTRTSSPPRGRRSSTRWSTPSSPAAARRRRAGDVGARARRERDRRHRGRSRSPSPSSAPRRRRAVIEVLRSGQLSLGPRVPAFEEAFAARLGAAHASAVSSGTAGLHLALRAVGVTDGDEVVTSPFSFVASANALRLRARAPGLRRHRPGHAEPRSRRRGGRGHRAHDRAAAGPHLRLPGRPAGLRAPRACRSSRTPARRSAPSTPTASRVGARGHPAVFGFYANKQLTTGEGGMVTLGDAAHEGAHRLRAQPGPRARHGLARPRPPRLQLPPDRHRLRDRPRSSSSAWTACSPTARGSPARYREALARHRGPRAAVRGRRRRPPRLVRLRRAGPARARPRRRHPRAARARRAVQALPAGDPPHELLPRDASATARASSRSARTSPRGRVALPFFPAHDRGPGRSAWPRHWREALRPGSIIGPCREPASRRAARTAPPRRGGSARSASPARGAAGRALAPRRSPPSPREFRLDAALPHHRLDAVGAHGARPALPRARRRRGPGATATAASTAPGTGAWSAGASRSTCSASRWPRRSPRSPTGV